MVRKLRDRSDTFVEGGRPDPEMRDDDKRSWLDELKEAFGFQGRHAPAAKKNAHAGALFAGVFHRRIAAHDPHPEHLPGGNDPTHSLQ